MHKIFKKFLIFIFIGGLALWGVQIYLFETKGTNLAFQSSDGNWADNEILFKNRNFEGIAVLFELYKINCNKPNAILQRITKKPNILTPSRWFDNYNSKKWLVPLAPHHPSLKGEIYYPKFNNMEHCYHKSSSESEFATAKRLAEQYINSL